MRKALIGAGIGLVAALFALLLGRLPFVEVVELKTYDWRMRATAGSVPARNDIVLVTIDEESIRGLEPLVGRWPWPRLVHAEVLNYLARAQPRVVLYDVLFTEHDRTKFFVQDQEWSGAASDQTLATAARAVPLVLPGDAVPEALEGVASSVTSEVAADERPIFVPPIAPLAAASRVVAHNFAVLDPDGPWRRYVSFVRNQGETIPSLAVATAAVALGRAPGDLQRTAGRLLIDYRSRRADGSSPYRRVSFYKLFYAEQQLLDGQTPLERPETLRDKIVVVGATASALDDVFTVPVAAGKVGGLEVHAAVVDGILSQRTLSPTSASRAIALTLTAAVALGVIGAFVGPWITTIVALALWGAITAFATSQFAAGHWYPLVVPLLALVLATFGDVAYEYFVEGREKRRVKRLFSRYVSKDVYEQLIKDPSGARLGGQRRRMTVMFSDIREFTTVSEKGEPEAIVAQLNEYFSRMVPIVFAHKGTIDKFVGDMIMALFGAPLDDPDHADHAVETALAMSAGLARLNREWTAAGRPALDIGIGINTGDMVAGNLGSEDIMSYTVIGDQVNLGARLESLNKDYHTRVIISDATRAALKGRYDIRALGDVVVKGKSVPVKIFSVVPPQAVLEGLNADVVATDMSGK
ncbi:MAG: adenylate/guanylate cyclase domain-containing protein, partial [Vicinamibacteria bacterium]|nr:adenylate/guanylate cyclase domain-containing protein [Vicinamibacteria bacterium]